MEETVAGALLIVVLGAALYLLPTVIILSRQPHHLTGPTIIVNVLLGWSVLGWIAALAMSFTSPRQAGPYVIYPGPPPQGTLPPRTAPGPPTTQRLDGPRP